MMKMYVKGVGRGGDDEEGKIMREHGRLNAVLLGGFMCVVDKQKRTIESKRHMVGVAGINHQHRSI